MSKGEPTSISVMRNFLQRRGSGAKKRQCGHLPLPGQIWLNGDTRRGEKVGQSHHALSDHPSCVDERAFSHNLTMK